ncbi:MAG: hypothetical protein Q9160_004826 [Pyrenula sp. 1 TL-2023]
MWLRLHFLLLSSAALGMGDDTRYRGNPGLSNLDSRAFASPSSNCTAPDKAMINQALLNLVQLSKRAKQGTRLPARLSYPEEIFMNVFRERRKRSRNAVHDRFDAVLLEVTASWGTRVDEEHNRRGWIDLYCEHNDSEQKDCEDATSFFEMRVPERAPEPPTTRIILCPPFWQIPDRPRTSRDKQTKVIELLRAFLLSPPVTFWSHQPALRQNDGNDVPGSEWGILGNVRRHVAYAKALYLDPNWDPDSTVEAPSSWAVRIAKFNRSLMSDIRHQRPGWKDGKFSESFRDTQGNLRFRG